MQNKWEQNSSKLVKTFQFQDFKEALKFINTVGQIAESMNHHPKIINLYNTVSLELWTHDQNAISDLDFQLADKIDRQIQQT
ncbi:MAG: 4a-hydroxytetrahydrobiopterin dehydratase [Flavobacteriaceae bacterium]|jgi:4a-hydroxytetrahydrobiopterin dehydratase|tara:strand:- start:445 stop:690 length:246 start_codon:yes stop_codon:yes gene_type:complete